MKGLRVWWAEAGGGPLDLFRAGAVATMEMRAGGCGERVEDDGAPALLALTIGVEETSLNVTIGALRGLLDVTSHVALVRTRRHVLWQVRHEKTLVRPSCVGYRGHAKDWWRYACFWTLEAVRQGRKTWMPSCISQAVRISWSSGVN